MLADLLPTYRIAFDLPGFDLPGVNHVRLEDTAARNRVDATLHVSAICECIEVMWPPLIDRMILDPSDPSSPG